MGSERLERILYVEDEPDVRAVAKLALETLGPYKVRVCASGAEALEVIGGWQPDLVVLDVVMPGMDGPTTLRRLRELPAGRSVPVAFVTGRISPDEVAQYHVLGVVGVVEKPFDPMGLARQLEEIWEDATAAGGPHAPGE